MALEIVMLIPFEGDKRCPFPQENVPLISVHFPQISVLFPPISVHFPRAFAVSAFWLRKLQTRKSGKEAVTHYPTAIGDERPETELSMTGCVNCKLCSCASKCTTNAHSLLKSDFRQISSKVYIDTFFLHVRKFQYFWRV